VAVRVGVMFTSDRVNGVTVLLICVSLMASLRLCLLWYAAARSVITPFIVVSLFLLDQTAPFYVELFFFSQHVLNLCQFLLHVSKYSHWKPIGPICAIFLFPVDAFVVQRLRFILTIFGAI